MTHAKVESVESRLTPEEMKTLVTETKETYEYLDKILRNRPRRKLKKRDLNV